MMVASYICNKIINFISSIEKALERENKRINAKRPKNSDVVQKSFHKYMSII